MLIREVMTGTVVTTEPSSSVRAVAELMRTRNVGSVVIAEGSRPVGFVTDRDLTLSVLAEGREGSERVSDHASSPVITVDPEMDVDAAAELMVRHGVRRLVVVEQGRVAGIVTLDDLAARIGDAELATQLSARVTRAVMPDSDFYFRERGD